MLLTASHPRLTGLEHEARQTRLTMETDVESDTMTRKRTEDAAVYRAKYGDKNYFARVDHDPMYLTSFRDDSTEPPALPCRNDALVDKGAEGPNLCL